ncbi:MAG: hypothetical protein WCL08_00230, partial [Verrucomicrobiota bacterium]
VKTIYEKSRRLRWRTPQRVSTLLKKYEVESRISALGSGHDGADRISHFLAILDDAERMGNADPKTLWETACNASPEMLASTRIPAPCIDDDERALQAIQQQRLMKEKNKVIELECVQEPASRQQETPENRADDEGDGGQNPKKGPKKGQKGAKGGMKPYNSPKNVNSCGITAEGMADILANPLQIRARAANLPVFGDKGRAGTLMEVLPEDFEGFSQTIRDAENLGRAEGLRGAGYRENITRTLLKLSQYAAALAESRPAQALLVMKDIAKLDAVAAKRFRLDQDEKETSASESLKRLSSGEEGDGAFLLE